MYGVATIWHQPIFLIRFFLWAKSHNPCLHAQVNGAAPVANEIRWVCVYPHAIFVKNLRSVRRWNEDQPTDCKHQQRITWQTNDRFGRRTQVCCFADPPSTGHTFEPDQLTFVTRKVSESRQRPDSIPYLDQ